MVPSWALLSLAALLPCSVFGIEFNLIDRGPTDPGAKCMLEEMNENVLVLLDYSSVDGTKISAKLEDPQGQVFWTLDGAVTGHYGFTTKKAGDYKICFTKSEPGSGDVTSHKVMLLRELHKCLVDTLDVAKANVFHTSFENLVGGLPTFAVALRTYA